ncbi:uncharacterized protein V3H82_023041 isoform 1-T1 [Fundulus diaphanus]
MPGQKKKYSVRFPPGRIKKIMQKDTEVGRIAMAVPVIISRALEMFLKSLLTKTCLITQAKFSNVVSVAHMKQCIESEKLFHFLKDLAEAATCTATQMDNKGMSVWPIYSLFLVFQGPKRTAFPFQNHLEQERSCPKGASSHLKVTPAQVSQSSTSAYNLAFQQHITSVEASFGVAASLIGRRHTAHHRDTSSHKPDGFWRKTETNASQQVQSVPTCKALVRSRLSLENGFSLQGES